MKREANRYWVACRFKDRRRKDRWSISSMNPWWGFQIYEAAKARILIWTSTVPNTVFDFRIQTERPPRFLNDMKIKLKTQFWIAYRCKDRISRDRWSISCLTPKNGFKTRKAAEFRLMGRTLSVFDFRIQTTRPPEF